MPRTRSARALRRFVQQRTRSARARSNVRSVCAFESEVTVRRTRFASDGQRLGGGRGGGRRRTPSCSSARSSISRSASARTWSATWVQDSRYGPQVKVTQATPLPPTDDDGRWSRTCCASGTSAPSAPVAVDRYGAATVFDAIDERPAARVPPPAPPRRAREAAALLGRAARRRARLHLLLAPHGLALPRRADPRDYGDRAHRVVSRAPVRADERVRRRLPDRRPDRPRGSACAARLARPHARGRAARADRGRARRHTCLPAGRCCWPAPASCSARAGAAASP